MNPIQAITGSVRYKRNTSSTFLRSVVFRGDVVLRTVHLPPFDPEWIVGVVRSTEGYRVFRLKASDFIWGVQEEEKEKLPTLRGIYTDKPIPTDTGLRLAALWRRFLGDRKNYGYQDSRIYGDNSHFVFSADGVTANTLAFDTGT